MNLPIEELVKQILEPIKEENKPHDYVKANQERFNLFTEQVFNWFTESEQQAILAKKNPRLTRQYIKQKIAEILQPEDVIELASEFIHRSVENALRETALKKFKDNPFTL